MTNEKYIREFRHMVEKYGEEFGAFLSACKTTYMLMKHTTLDGEGLNHVRDAIIDRGSAAIDAIWKILEKQGKFLLEEGVYVRVRFLAHYARCIDSRTRCEHWRKRFRRAGCASFVYAMYGFRTAIQNACEAMVTLYGLQEVELVKEKGGGDD